MQITVPIDIWRTSQNAFGNRTHWRVKAGIIKRARAAGYLSWVKYGKPQIPEVVTVDVLVRRFRRFDEPNVPGALKPVFDGIFTDGLKQNDSRIKLGDVSWDTGKQWKRNEEVVLTFRESEGE